MILLRPLALSILFALVVFGVSAPFNRAMDEPVSWEERIQYLKDHQAEFDFVFVGSSRVLSNVDPRILAEGLRPRIPNPRGFNIGIAGYGGHGIDQTLRSLGDALRGKVVFVEAVTYTAHMRRMDDGAFARQDVKWHSLFQTLSAIHTAFEENFEQVPLRRVSAAKTPAQRIMLVYGNAEAVVFAGGAASMRSLEHLLQFCRNHLPVGFGFETPPDRMQAADAQFDPADPESGLGYHRIKEDLRMSMTREAWDETLEKVTRSRSLNLPSGPNDWAFRKQLEFLESVGAARVFHVIFPHANEDTPRWIARFRELGDHQPGAPGCGSVLLDYNDPEAYPGLFEYAARFDSTHLTNEKTADFTRIIAEDVRRLLSPSVAGAS